jgi:AraC family transcriptional regulator
MSAIAKTIWLIESRSQDPLTLDEMASHAGLSRSHLSRVFPIATGYSISAYIRGRRLTEAARALASGAPDILAVALEAGYGSHEAFTRAFRDQFGIPMDATIAVPVDAPRIEDRGPMQIAGLMERHVLNRAASVPGQWQRFQPYIGNVPGAVPGRAYGVVGEMGEECDDFDYLCGMEVTDAAELPPEFTRLRLPAQRTSPPSARPARPSTSTGSRGST